MAQGQNERQRKQRNSLIFSKEVAIIGMLQCQYRIMPKHQVASLIYTTLRGLSITNQKYLKTTKSLEIWILQYIRLEGPTKFKNSLVLIQQCLVASLLFPSILETSILFFSVLETSTIFFSILESYISFLIISLAQQVTNASVTNQLENR